jgi:hypothetical protein
LNQAGLMSMSSLAIEAIDHRTFTRPNFGE